MMPHSDYLIQIGGFLMSSFTCTCTHTSAVTQDVVYVTTYLENAHLKFFFAHI